MRFKYFYVSFLKWLALTVLTFFMVNFLLPDSWSGYGITLPMWLLTFLVAFLFAEWMFHGTVPSKRDVAMALLAWFSATFVLEAAHETFLWGRPGFLLFSNDLHVGLFMELLAVLFSSFVTRRRRVKAVLGEGLAE